MGTKMLVIFLSFFISHSVFASSSYDPSLLPSYYPQSFIDVAKNQKEKIKDTLFLVLSKAHHLNPRSPGERDQLGDNCQEEEKNNCFMHSGNISYSQARKYLFGLLHLKENDGRYFVTDSYCQRDIGEDLGAGPLSIPNSMEINCEHTWPQSLFNPRFPANQQKVDLHHLFPVDSRSNSTRGNRPLRDLVEGREAHENCQSSQTGMALNGKVKISAFWPPQNHRGNVARALFYFSVRYQLPLDYDYEKNLKQWHRQDPVDQEEIKRNEAIFKIQSSRNPFIDSPELVEQISDF